MARTECVLLEHERFAANFVEDGKCQVKVLPTLQEVLHLGILMIDHSFTFVLNLPLSELHSVFDSFNELFAHGANEGGLFLQASI